ncbi:type II secretion system protein [Massilia sp. CCM 9210]|uniref:type II secretion system protein n=1 Tax=Massilia scottii TaxID=3057166 RepID=UPI002796D568|nr:type II secretion system protein [Massilia sp. CCM 9210]MDQ1815213.1 type II secretion system protein [Massilia sp. CCM 9210]
MTATANRIATGKAPPRRTRAGGFTYLGLIILVTVIGLVGAASLKVGSLMQRAAAEEELLDIGAAFSDALRSYAAATPQGQPQQPPSLQELLKDPRFPNPRRHLRKIFVDPITGKAEWGIMYISDKQGVLGVYSLSDAPPLKIGNFDARFLNMENKSKLSDWKFTLSSQTLLLPQEPSAAPGQNQAPPLFPPAAPPPEGAMKPPEEPAAAMPPPAEAPEPDAAAPPEPAAGEARPEEPPAADDPAGRSTQDQDTDKDKDKAEAEEEERRRDERQRDEGRRNEPRRER